MQQEKPLLVYYLKNELKSIKLSSGSWERGEAEGRGETSPSLSLLLIDIAFVIGVGVAAATVLHVDHALIKVGQGYSVLLVDVTLHVSLQ